MGLRINQNIAAQNAYRALSVSDNQMSKSLEKLSSGFRINRAADDAAGLSISEGLRSQVGGLKVAARNAQDGVSVVQTAEGALTEVHAVLQRMRDLSVQAANDSNSTDARANITTEVNSLVDELDRVSSSTNFSGTNLLDGTAGGGTGKLKFQVGANGDAASTIEVDLSTVDIKHDVADVLRVGNNATTFAFNDAAAATVTGSAVFTATDGATTTVATVDLTPTTPYTSVSEVADALNADAGFSATFKATVTTDAAGVATGISVRSLSNGVVDTTAPGATGMAAAGTASTTAGALDFTDNAAAQASITSIDTAIAYVSSARSSLGSNQNRLEHTINNLNVSVENLSASESRIRDTDMAQEMMSFTRSQILSQAGTAMLAQANQSQQGVLSLLR